MSHTATTQLEEDRQYAKLPVQDNKTYLLPKADTAMKLPNVAIQIKDGAERQINLRQITMSGLIRADEHRFDYLWYYKAEVNFDMPLSGKGVPVPFMSQTSSDPNRRHHLTPFPQGNKKGRLRRPDLVIVKDKSIRWPGRAAMDHQGVWHEDNLHRVVEVKFPKDPLKDEQRDAYLQISGGRERFTLLHVSSSDKRQEQTQSGSQTNNVPLILPPPILRDDIPRGEGRRIPVYSPVPLPEPAFYETWLDDAQSLASDLATEGAAALEQLSDKMKELLKEHAPWLMEAGQWVEDKAAQTWCFINEQGQKVYEWTTAQLKSLWEAIRRQTDLTLEELSKVDWMQVLMDLGDALTTVVLVIAGVVVVVVVAVALAAVLVLLVKLVAAALAGSAALLAALAAIFGAATLATLPAR
jgi:hypothetical protein